MTENPNAPDPRIGEIGKALDEFEEAARAVERSFFNGNGDGEFVKSAFNRQEKRSDLIKLIRRLIDHV